MAIRDSALNPEDLERAREMLAERARPERMWPVLAAALFAALCALAFAGAMITAPPVVSEHVVHSAS